MIYFSNPYVYAIAYMRTSHTAKKKYFYISTHETRFLDENECKGVKRACHTNASCQNTLGSFSCSCNQGFTGNGTDCQGTIYTSLKSHSSVI